MIKKRDKKIPCTPEMYQKRLMRDKHRKMAFEDDIFLQNVQLRLYFPVINFKKATEI